MPLDAAGARARARIRRPAAVAHRALPEGTRALRRHARRRCAGRLHAGSAPVRRRGRGAGKTQTIRFVNIRETAGWSAEARAATPKIAALLAWRRCPSREPVPRVAFKSRGPAADRRPGRRGACLGRGASGSARRHRADHRRGDRPSCRRSATTRSARASSTASRAGSARSTSSGRRTIRSTSTCARAATPASRPVPSTRSTGLPDRPRPLPGLTAQCVAACGAIGAIDFGRAARKRARASTSIWCSTCSASRRSRMHQPPQGYSRRAPMPLAQAHAAGRAARAGRRVREAEVLRRTRRRSARTAARSSRLQRSASTSARPRRSAPTATTIAVEPHLCMGCGACTTVCPSGALTYAYPRVPDLGARLRTLLATYAQGRRPRRLPAVPRRGRAPALIAAGLGAHAARACRRA